MTIKAGHKLPAFTVMIVFFGFILVDYQTGLWEKYLVTWDWSQSIPAFIVMILLCFYFSGLINRLYEKYFVTRDWSQSSFAMSFYTHCF